MLVYSEVSSWRKRLQARRLVLLEQGWIGKASGWPVPSVRWEKGVYLHLLFSLPSGRRDVYIGSDPDAVTEAIRGVMAQKELQEINRKLFALDQTEKVIENSLQELEFSLLL